MIQENINLATRNTFHLDANARYFCEASCDDELFDALALSRDQGLDIIVLGGGSNIVFTRDFDGLVISPAYKGINITGETVVIGAGENWHDMVRHCLEQGLSGIENMSLIPGCCGAAPMQNIGAYGQEFAEVFVELHAVRRATGEKLRMSKEDCKFGYRDSIFKHELNDQLIITGVTLKLARDFEPVIGYEGIKEILEENNVSSPTAIDVSDAVVSLRNRKLPNPAIQGNVGSFFKNPIVSSDLFSSLKEKWPQVSSNDLGDGQHKIHAAWLIEKAGMKGFSIGGAMVSEQHALVIVNRRSATISDVLTLCDEIQTRVKREFDIHLEIEPTFC